MRVETKSGTRGYPTTRRYDCEFETNRWCESRVGLPELSSRNFLGIVWIVNFEGIVVDWEIAQRRVALGERATLTGARNDGQ